MRKELYIVADFDRKTLPAMYSCGDDYVSVWSPTEMVLLSRINPLQVLRVNKATGSAYPVQKQNLTEQAKTLAGFLMFSIDNSFFKGVMRPRMVETKVRNHQHMLQCLGEESDLVNCSVTEENLVDLAYKVKSDAIGVARRFVTDYQSVLLEPEITPEFIAPLHNIFPSLERVIQFGSSVNGGGKDIDVILMLDKITPSIYHSMRGMRDSIVTDRPLSVVMLPPDGMYLTAACDAHNRVIAQGAGKLIYGSALNFPFPSESEYIVRDYSSAGKELSSLRGALGDNDRILALARSREFLQDTLKLELWIGKALRQYELQKSLSKDEAVFEESFKMAQLPQTLDVGVVRDLLYDANCRVKLRIETHLDRLN